MRLPDGLPQQVVGLAELDGNHDPPVHGLVQVVGTVGGHDDQPVVSGREEEGGREGGMCSYWPCVIVPPDAT